MSDEREIEAALEAILFLTPEPVAPARLAEMFGDHRREEVDAALARLGERYREAPERGLLLEKVAGGLRLVTRPDLHPWLRRFFEARGRSKLSVAALETLAIVAYRQPVSGPEIRDLRGVDPSGVLRTLLERRLIRIAGRKPVVGKPFLYATTREFLIHFGLESLSDLPPLEEFEETFGPPAEAGEEEAAGGERDGQEEASSPALAEAER